MSGRNIDFGGWLRAIPQGMTYFGLAMIALIWGAVEFHLNDERERSEATAILSTSNLARVFEEQIVRTIKANDRILRSLQIGSRKGTLQEDFRRWAAEVDNWELIDHLAEVSGRLLQMRPRLLPRVEALRPA